MFILMIKPSAFFSLIRIKHWIKNLFLFIPCFFAGNIFYSNVFLIVSLGGFSFSLIASVIYILNDIQDIEKDNLHPKKKFRAIASGAVSILTAKGIAVILFITGFGLAYFLSIQFLWMLLIYFSLNLGYSFGLKNIPILDVTIIAIGFELRIFSGGFLSGDSLSPWLVIMILLLALFIAMAKRRDDVLIKLETNQELRMASKSYNLSFLDHSISLLMSSMIVVYAVYVITIAMERGNNYQYYYFSIIFVILGILRYLQMAHVEQVTGNPIALLYKDVFLKSVLLLWLVFNFFIIYF